MKGLTVPFRLAPVVLALLVVILVFLIFEQTRLVADRNADQQASIRVLAQYHRSFLRRHNLLNEYKMELLKCQDNHPGLMLMNHYVRSIERDAQEEEQ